MTGNPLTELTLEQLRTRTSRKWRTSSSDVLPLWIAEMDVDLAPPIVDALTAALAQGDTGYPAGEDYADAYRGFAKRTWGWDVDLAATASMPDVMRGMTALLGLVTAPGDALVITTPVYPPCPRRTGCRLRDGGDADERSARQGQEPERGGDSAPRVPRR